MDGVGHRAEPHDPLCFALSFDNPPRTGARVSTSTTPRPTCGFHGYPQIQQALVRVPPDIDLYRTRTLEQNQVFLEKASHSPRRVWGREAVLIGGMS